MLFIRNQTITCWTLRCVVETQYYKFQNENVCSSVSYRGGNCNEQIVGLILNYVNVKKYEGDLELFQKGVWI